MSIITFETNHHDTHKEPNLEIKAAKESQFLVARCIDITTFGWQKISRVVVTISATAENIANMCVNSLWIRDPYDNQAIQAKQKCYQNIHPLLIIPRT